MKILLEVGVSNAILGFPVQDNFNGLALVESPCLLELCRDGRDSQNNQASQVRLRHTVWENVGVEKV